jgi:hypothetical protein
MFAEATPWPATINPQANNAPNVTLLAFISLFSLLPIPG